MSREAILSRIRTALNAHPGPSELPAEPFVWPTKNLSTDEMTLQFQESLTSIAGEFLSCESFSDAAQKIETMLRENGAKKIGVARRDVIQETLQHAPSFSISTDANTDDFEWVYAPAQAADVSPEQMGQLDAGIIGAEYLLADTGSCMICSTSAFDRMLCYLPPLCIVVAKREMLREHMPAVWSEITTRINTVTDPNPPIREHGEFLIVTGPSRTADIEKILILGVHGPKRLIVYLLP